MAEYTLLPQRENLHGVLDPALPPALRVRSGDTVHVTTLEADWRLGRPQGSPPKAPLFPRIKGRDGMRCAVPSMWRAHSPAWR